MISTTRFSPDCITKSRTFSSAFSPFSLRIRHRTLSRPSHLLRLTRHASPHRNSLPQFSTSDDGHVTTALLISGVAHGDCVSAVKIRLMAVSVLPSPISSARMQPFPLKPPSPLMQLYRNSRPSFWCGFIFWFSAGSRMTGAVVFPRESTNDGWMTKESAVCV